MIYLDNAATTQTDEQIADFMHTVERQYGNPSSMYDIGKDNRETIELCRKVVADSINAEPEEIIFTSGGSEADNLAIKGTIMEIRMREAKQYDSINKWKAGRIRAITSSIEHPAILNSFKDIIDTNRDFLFILNPDPNGIISPDDLKSIIQRQRTDIVSIMAVNNEIGSIQDIKAFGKICRENGAIFHTDAVQAFGHMKINVKDMNVDMMSVSGHKIYGPKGSGFLYVSKDIRKPLPLISGGGQEYGLRNGTENVSGIVGLTLAVQLLEKFRKDEHDEIISLRERIIQQLKNISRVTVNNIGDNYVPSILSITVEDIDNQSLVQLLNDMEIYVSAGSACHSNDPEPSYVLKSLGYTDKKCNETIRVSLGRYNTEEDADKFCEALKTIVGLV